MTSLLWLCENSGMAEQAGFNWVLDTDPRIDEFNRELESHGRTAFFSAVDEEKNLGFEVVDSFACFCLKYDEKPSPWFWKHVERADARSYLVNLLDADLAYDTKLIHPSRAEAMTDRFLALFNTPQSHVFFVSNRGWDATTGRPASHGFSVSGATFNIAVIGVTKDRIGLLLAEDED